MADDIDDLLNEVEKDYCTTNTSRSTSSWDSVDDRSNMSRTKSPARPKATSNMSNSCRRGVQSDGSGISAMIDDILDDPDDDVVSTDHQRTKEDSGSRANDRTPTQRKCFPVYLGGAACSQGIGSTVSQRSCDRLRCTDCDFSISTFDNFKWDLSADYLFLRNNMPDFDRVKPKLIHKKGYRAYACQCKSRSLRDLLDLQTDLDLKWVCGKH